MRWSMSIVVVVAFMGITWSLASAPPDATETYAWSGDEAFTSEPFDTGGAMEITLAAWCHEGVSSVTVTVFELSGEAAGEFVVRGQGTFSEILDLPAGTYYLGVSSPTMPDYHWEVLVQTPAPQAGAEDAEGAAGEGLPTETVEIPHAWSGDEEFTTELFETAGAWEITLGAYCHEGVSFVQVVAHDEHGEEVGELTVRGEGVGAVILELEPGTYFLRVTSPTMQDYTWELVVRPVEAVGQAR